MKKEFKDYLESNYQHIKSIPTITSDAFYIDRHDIGINLYDALKNEQSLYLCKKKLEQYFSNVKKVKSPKSNSSSYLYSITLLKEYIDNTYGEIAIFLKKTPTMLPGLKVSPNTINNKIAKIPFPKPSEQELKKYVNRWYTLENYVAQEKVLNKLFLKTYPNNNDIEEVLLKVCTLNAFYSTNIYSPYTIAKHIVDLDIDKKLKAEDLSLVDDIAIVTMDNGNIINFYSFATKYCSRHKPLIYPIYDSYVDEVLWYYQKKGKLNSFKRKELKDYTKFNEILINFKSSYNIKNKSLKDLDKYLWQYGKEFFSKKKK